MLRESSREAQVSVLSRKRAAETDAASTRARLQQPARPIVLARAAVPMAKTAGKAAQDGARSAGTWVAPRVNGARAWTAPRIERSGLAIRDTIAPKICEMLTATARRMDVTAPRVGVAEPRRRWPTVVAGAALLTAAGAAAAVVLRRGRMTGPAGHPGKRPTRAPARRSPKTVSRAPAPTAATRKQTSASQPRQPDQPRGAPASKGHGSRHHPTGVNHFARFPENRTRSGRRASAAG